MLSPPQSIDTPITRMFGIKYPVLLAGMNVAAGPELAACISNAGGLGVIGGMNYTPPMLRMMIRDLKKKLFAHDLPFGVDLMLPKVGDGARKTNYDYTKGLLNELIDVIIEEGVKLFVSAVGVPPKEIVNRLHENGIYVMNMVGSPKHVDMALEVGVDIICAQGSEGGGHTGDIGTMVLIPAVVDRCKNKISPMTKQQVQVIAAGGIYDGRTMAAALCLGASAVWIGTRFVASEEANAPKAHKESVLKTHHDGTMRTLVFTGRPLRISTNYYAQDWHTRRRKKLELLLKEGSIPCNYDLENISSGNIPEADQLFVKKILDGMSPIPHLMGQVAGSIHEIKPAIEILHQMVSDTIRIIHSPITFIRSKI